MRIRGKKCLFFGNFGVLCILETPVLRFALLPYYRRYYLANLKISNRKRQSQIFRTYKNSSTVFQRDLQKLTIANTTGN